MSKRAKSSQEAKSGRAELKKLINTHIRPSERVALASVLARGVKMKDEVTGVVYGKAPDLGALRFLEEYATGKPPQAIEVDDEMAFGFILVPSQKRSSA